MAEDVLTDEPGTAHAGDQAPPATHPSVAGGGALGVVGGAIAGALAAGPVGAVIGAVVGGVSATVAAVAAEGAAESGAAPELTAPDLTPQLRERAYSIYEARGRGDGHALDDWLAAERELLVA